MEDGKGCEKEERRGQPSDRGGGPENGETIQSAADAANCPLIIRTRAGGDAERGGGRWKGAEGRVVAQPRVFLVFVG